jgi:hypothetical protein
MRAQDVSEFVRKQPFEPFRITLTNGVTYDVVHPDLAMVGHRTVTIGLPRPNGPQAIYDRVVSVSFLHVMQIEPVPQDENPTNGTQEG